MIAYHEEHLEEDVAMQYLEPGVEPTIDPNPSNTTPSGLEPVPADDGKNPAQPPTQHPLPEWCRPHLWAMSRQALCESFPWFCAYQSGVYIYRGYTKGYLLSAFASARDLFHHSGKLIISHGGGKARVVNSGPGQNQADTAIVAAGDQGISDASVRALMRNYKMGLPLALIADDKYRLFPYGLGKHTYAVLGMYWIVAAWAEREPSAGDRGFCVKFKFAFQWIEYQGNPWWWETPDRSPEIPVPAAPPQEYNCSTCSLSSPIIYQPGSVCLQPECPTFWSSENSELPSTLTYSENFLRLREPHRLHKHIEKLQVRVPKMTSDIATSEECWRGWCCPKCGLLSSRERWECWYCSDCGEEYHCIGRLRNPLEFVGQDQTLPFQSYQIHPMSGVCSQVISPMLRIPRGITSRIRHLHLSEHDQKHLTCHSFHLPDSRGTIVLISGNEWVNGEADKIFRQYQEDANEKQMFRRHPLRTHHLRGQMLTNYFSHNAGKPYRYAAGYGVTVPFEKSPKSVNMALELIKARASLALDRPVEFDEVLSAAYMVNQKMSFHSDSEPGLGPTVSSLSLGSHALMHFRIQSFALPDGETRCKHLSIVLRHGDVLVMNGAEIQTYYEHAVIPQDFRIAATARLIDTSVNGICSLPRR